MTKLATSQVTLEKMRHTLATFSLPEQLVTDNGSSFTSVKYGQFMHHIKTAP